MKAKCSYGRNNDIKLDFYLELVWTTQRYQSKQILILILF